MSLATSKAVLTGAYPTGAPATLTANAVAALGPSVDFVVIATASSGVVTALMWIEGLDKWVPLGDIAVNSANYGGMTYERFTPGNGAGSHYLVWEKTAGATYADPNCWIMTDVQR